MLNVAIVEDDERATARLRAFIERFAEQSGERIEIATFPEPTRFLEGYRPIYDIVFMDIEMPTMNGMKAAARLREMDSAVVLIFVTNMAQYAAKGYEVAAMDYIVKPYAYPDFERKLRRAVASTRHAAAALLVRQQAGTQRVLLRDILYIEVRGHGLIINTDSGVVRGSGTLSETQEKLATEGFFRCSKAYLVNQKHIVIVRGSSLALSNGNELAIGRAYKKSFMNELAAYLGKSHVL